MIHDYFNKVREKLKYLVPIIKHDDVSFEMVSIEMGIIRGKVVFINGSIFEFRELLSSNNHDYRFHWMDSNNKLIIRWDSAPHHIKLINFPFHSHDNKGAISSEEINLLYAFDYIKKEIVYSLLRK